MIRISEYMCGSLYNLWFCLFVAIYGLSILIISKFFYNYRSLSRIIALKFFINANLLVNYVTDAQ